MWFSFTAKYIVALSIIALFSIMAYFNLNNLTKAQEDDGEIINKSGRQRMLSQNIALNILKKNKIELQKAITLMRVSHEYLINKPMSKKIKDIYYNKPTELDYKVKKYIEEAQRYIKSDDINSHKYILNNSKNILKALDLATFIYQQESDLRVKNLRQNELYILILTLLTLVLEAIFIYRPADTSIKKKTKELLEQKEYLNIITQTNTNAIIAIDSTFTILTFNKSAERMFGYSADEMLYTKLTDDRIIPKRFLDQHNQGLRDFVKSGRLKHEDAVFELVATTKTQKEFPIRISFGIRADENIKIIVANIQNISGEKEKDQIIIEQSRFAAMGEMIGNIAHQWRQPLSSISALSSGAKLRYKNGLIDDNELEDTFDKIKYHTQHLSKTIDDFRDFLKQDASKENFNIIDVMQSSITLIEATYKNNGIKIILDIKKDDLIVNGSSSQLSQVFLNILNNAKDVLLEQEIEDKIVYISLHGDAHNAIIKIQDNAGGVPKNIMSQIFDPYFTTKHKSQGTGIGLFMSKKIIEQIFNGKLSVKNSHFVADNTKYLGAAFKVSIKLI